VGGITNRFNNRRSRNLPARKRATARTSQGSFKANSSTMSVGTPEIRDPLFSPEGFYLTNQDIKTYNRWIRYYDAFHPILPNSLDIHSHFPISDFSFKGVNDSYVSQFYDFVKNDVLNLLNWVLLASSEYERLGEAFTFFQWDSYNGYYNTATILNPDLLEIYPFDWEGDRRFVISMDIPETFQVLYDKKNIDSRYRKMWQALDPVIRRCVESGLPIPLNPDNVFGMQRLQHAYDVRGTSQVLRVLKDLMYEDKLREAQMAVADGHITPYQIWKIGNSQTGYIPSEAELKDWDSLLATAEHQNLYRIVTHSDVEYETKGVQDGLLNITAEMDKIEDRILTALYTSRAMTTGEGPCVSADTEVLTREGFKLFPDVTMEDEIASVNPDTHEMEFCLPKEILCFNVEGPMVHFNHGSLDHLVTPNHRCYVKANSPEFEIKLAEDVKPYHKFMSSVAPFNGLNPSVSEIKIGERFYDLKSYLRLVGLYLSEGSVEYSRAGTPTTVVITRTRVHKKGINERFQVIYDAVFSFDSRFKFHEYETEDGHKGRFRLYDPAFASHILENYSSGAFSKKIPSFIRGFSSEVLKNLLEGCFLGDGSFLNKARSTGSYEIYTVSKELADNLQEVVLKCGHPSIVKTRSRALPRKTIYRVRVFLKGAERGVYGSHPSVGSPEHIKSVPYKGNVYSFDLPPNRLYVSRRNGMITVTGNTYSNAVIGLKVLEGRYQNKLYRIAGIIRSLFKKIALANDFYESTDAEVSHGVYKSKADRKLIVPLVHWDNYFSFAKDLERAKFYQGLAEAHKISWRRVLEILGLDFEEERETLKEDMRTVLADGVYDSEVAKIVGEDNPAPGGPPTNLDAPPSSKTGPMDDVGAETPDGASAPPLPTIDM